MPCFTDVFIQGALAACPWAGVRQGPAPEDSAAQRCDPSPWRHVRVPWK